MSALVICLVCSEHWTISIYYKLAAVLYCSGSENWTHHTYYWAVTVICPVCSVNWTIGTYYKLIAVIYCNGSENWTRWSYYSTETVIYDGVSFRNLNTYQTYYSAEIVIYAGVFRFLNVLIMLQTYSCNWTSSTNPLLENKIGTQVESSESDSCQTPTRSSSTRRSSSRTRRVRSRAKSPIDTSACSRF